MRYSIPDLEPGQRHDSELNVEKSRFIAWVAYTSCIEDVDILLHQARQAYPDASHHCHAFIAGAPGEQNAIGFSDDGEPGGTAGRPMYRVLEGADLGQIGCVVTRYFGGTKLGTGGLARAYAQAVNQALASLPRRDHIERRQRRLQVDFASEAETRAWLADHAIPIERADYDSAGVTLSVGWPEDDGPSSTELHARLKGRLFLPD
ncbi:IMPACT family protein [Aidingimonas lacisalsi]|uniref:IMPACT family protein n=1 Tax=Aidingimonas lacisalsi TaxID=2604086 RepID=UPI0011D248FE|nr:YigZ family protein [Aidingimonas lacisalsi]